MRDLTQIWEIDLSVSLVDFHYILFHVSHPEHGVKVTPHLHDPVQ